MAYCTNCGAELSEGSKFCSECGTATSGTTNTGDINASNNERVIKEGLCNRVKSKLFVENGHGLLTNKRFIYNKHGFGKILAMGAFVNLTKGIFDFEIDLESIEQLKDGKQGISKTIIICTKDGGEYNFYFSDRQIWVIEFKNLLGEDRIHCTM